MMEIINDYKGTQASVQCCGQWKVDGQPREDLQILLPKTGMELIHDLDQPGVLAFICQLKGQVDAQLFRAAQLGIPF